MNIIRKKKRNRIYFYLRHNSRKGNRVVTEDRYLGTGIPKNINRIKEEFMEEINLRLNRKLESIKKSFQDEWNKMPESARKRELEEISISFTYNTNAIEGSAITLQEARDIIHDQIAPNKPLRDIKETEAHSKIFLNMLHEKRKMDKMLILEWHKEIFGQTKEDISGKFRDYLVRVGEYVAPDWQDVERLMKELIIFIEKNSKINPVELAARAHYKFEKIHPFGDGNGRIGRLIINYILWHSGYPILIIEYKKRKSYYKALQKDENAFVSYFIRRYLSVYKERINKQK